MNDDPAARQASPRWRRWLRDLLVLALVVAAVQWWQARDLPRGAAPPLAGLLVDGRPFQLDPADGPYLVHFWASWCPVCRLEQGSIDRLAAAAPVITVATSSGDRDEVAAYLAEQGVTMPVLMDEEGRIAAAWGVRGVPAAFVVDTAGDIAYATTGYSTGPGLRLRLWLAD